MIENYQIRENARHHLDNRLFGTVWMRLLVVSLIGGLIIGIPSSINGILTLKYPKVMAIVGIFLAIGTIVLSGPISYAMARIFLKVTRGDKNVDYSDLLCGFKEELAEAILLDLMRAIYTILWSLLLIIPGIIKAYSYSMASYIQQEAKDKTWRNCIERSMELTDGYKGRLFLLDLSFIGWYFLGLLCFGVGVLWVSVYHGAARAEFYEQLKKEKNIDFTTDKSAEPFQTEEEKKPEGTDVEPFAEMQEQKDEPKNPFEL